MIIQQNYDSIVMFTALTMSCAYTMVLLLCDSYNSGNSDSVKWSDYTLAPLATAITYDAWVKMTINSYTVYKTPYCGHCYIE